MQLIDHVSITVDDIGRARPFYDAVMAALHVVRIGERADWLGYGERCRDDDDGHSYLSVRLGPPSQAVASTHWCFKAASRADVDLFWRAGTGNGGTCDGPPGLRDYHPHYYAAFLIDPAGNRLEAVCHKKADR
ncbi:MAG: VOC family protein [Geminicoccaceae bacterium]